MNAEAREFTYVIIGAGPGGLQLGYYLGQLGRDYVILERGTQPGMFFQTFPRHRKLISINKVYTGVKDPDTNLRWDWNSLLTAEPEFNFTSYSKEYFPDAGALIRYLADFSERYELHVEYETEITKIRRDAGGFSLQSNRGEIRAKRLIIATGRSRLRLPDLPGMEHIEPYSRVSIDPNDFIDQRVLIMGKGNSGFETGDNLVGVTAVIHMLSPNPIRMAWKTHYVGDLRAVNNNILDTYQLKSQNTIIDASVERIERRPDGSLDVSFRYSHAEGQTRTVTVDRVIACTGFGFDDGMFDPETCKIELDHDGRFPRVTSEWESTSVPHLFFAGALMHGRDYKKSFSGFIHGFRYNIECLTRLLERRYEGAPLEATGIEGGAAGLTRYIIDRVNRCSSLFQQPGFLSDAIVPSADAGRFTRYRDVPVDFAIDHALPAGARFFTLTMEYGKFDPVADPFNTYRFPNDGTKSAFIHPIVRFREASGAVISEHHIPEDLENNWDAPMYMGPLEGYLTESLAKLYTGPEPQ